MRKKIINCLIQFKARSNKHNERLRKKRTIDKVVIYYRICDAGYPKVKPTYITKENCLRNAVRCFPLEQVEWHVLGDNICDETYNMILKYIPQNQVKRVSVGHGAGTFRMVYEEALSNSDNTLVYFLEDDYVHVSNSFDCLKAIAKENFADYITLYDHPDKYGYKNQNPFVSGGGIHKAFYDYKPSLEDYELYHYDYGGICGCSTKRQKNMVALDCRKTSL